MTPRMNSDLNLDIYRKTSEQQNPAVQSSGKKYRFAETKGQSKTPFSDSSVDSFVNSIESEQSQYLESKEILVDLATKLVYGYKNLSSSERNSETNPVAGYYFRMVNKISSRKEALDKVIETIAMIKGIDPDEIVNYLQTSYSKLLKTREGLESVFGETNKNGQLQ